MPIYVLTSTAQPNAKFQHQNDENCGIRDLFLALSTWNQKDLSIYA
jgi:hypothetical protein